jgi:L,D-transpeptidase-like protein
MPKLQVERRSFPRPPLWLTLLLLVISIAGVAYARYHRQQIATRFAQVLTQEQRTPTDIRKIKDQLADMNLTQAQLQQELNGRAQFLQSLQTADFFLSVDTQERKLRFYYGNTVLREAPLTLGSNAEIKAPDGRHWTFVPVRGSFKIESKVVDYPWQIPEWVYAMSNEPVPASPPAIQDGLGKYVIFIGNGYAIHSPPDEKSPLKGAKPGSFMVPDDDLRAIWPRIHIGTPVYIY